ncbi:class I SAM-dependent DNA methyltransferase [Tropicibacter oceani]|uniref:Class I SAM-dependent methyltransferase n=1 Tax=Tropicibacter oceani TaxID=3058420 RepID=A0ABY8QLT5_9RHOB|nr:class I SAM-dependent methyltransferase [Tropicibacter oceani]WGW05500.1 class I SAM-dependent methyltransferase [Tropicibacter oceani]
MTTDSAFWDRIAVKYAARPVGDPAAYETTLQRVRHWLRPDMAVLELGCGTGTTALRLSDAVRRYTATDAAQGMLDIAMAKPVPDGGALRFVRAEAQEAVQPGYDVILAFSLLHLLPGRRDLMAQVRAALPAGGVFISKTPCLAGKPWFRPLIAVLRWFGKAPPGVGFVSPSMLQAELREAGFEIVETGDYPKSLPNHFIVARAV